MQCNFAYLNTETGDVELRRADRNFEDAGPILCEMLDGLAIPSFPDHSVAVKYATEHRCGVRVRGPGLSDTVTGTDPLKDNLPLRTSSALDSTSEAAFTAGLVNALSRRMTELLQGHDINRLRVQQGKPPANCVLLRGCGARIKMPTFADNHGLSAFMIAPTCLIRGLGMCLEMDIIDVPGGTGDYHTDLSAKASFALSTLRDKERHYDLGFVHVKVGIQALARRRREDHRALTLRHPHEAYTLARPRSPTLQAVDDAGHDKDLARKAEFLEKADAMVMQVLVDGEEGGGGGVRHGTRCPALLSPPAGPPALRQESGGSLTSQWLATFRISAGARPC